MDIFNNPIFRITASDYIRVQAALKKIDKEKLDNKIEELKKELITINDSPYTGPEQMERINDIEYMLDWLMELKNYRKNSGD